MADVSKECGHRRSKREHASIDYAAIEEGISIPLTSDFYFLESDDSLGGASGRADKWAPLVDHEDGVFDSGAPVRQLPGENFTEAWAKDDGLIDPVLVPRPTGLGITVPPPSFRVRDVVERLGEYTPVHVMDVATQEELSGWTLGRWLNYFEATPQQRAQFHSPKGATKGTPSPLNVISLEFSDTSLASLVKAPGAVRKLDLVSNAWPDALRERGHFPKAQLYCLMSVAGCYTDFHLDFGGTSVWYHVHTGQKTFLLVPPTVANLEAYRAWSSSPHQSTTFFADTCSVCYRVTVEAGQTMVIPCGWIHAVHTPVDSLVFGGNFLHALAIEGQLKVYDLEQSLKIKERFRFPFFRPAMWYSLAHLLLRLRRYHGGPCSAAELRDGEAAEIEAEEESQGASNNEEEGNRDGAGALSLLECESLPLLIDTCRGWHRNRTLAPARPAFGTSAATTSCTAATTKPHSSSSKPFSATTGTTSGGGGFRLKLNPRAAPDGGAHDTSGASSGGSEDPAALAAALSGWVRNMLLLSVLLVFAWLR